MWCGDIKNSALLVPLVALTSFEWPNYNQFEAQTLMRHYQK